jgi:hypothetical protein
MNEQVRENYLSGSSLILPSGWRLGPNNPSPLSASNFIVQGRGACILQTACRKIDEAGLMIIFTMHDEIAVLCNTKDEENVCKVMKLHMLDAASDVLGEPGMKIGEPEILRHGDWWTDHSDKAIKGWGKIGKYFENLKNTKIF